MDMTNGGLYASLMNQYGSKEESGAFVLMSLESGPLMTMVILGSAGLASFEPHHFIGAVLPFTVGFALGNLDHDFRAFFSKATPVLIPFFGFCAGQHHQSERDSGYWTAGDCAWRGGHHHYRHSVDYC